MKNVARTGMLLAATVISGLAVGGMALAGLTVSLAGQQKPKVHVPVAKVAARAADVSSPEAIVKADYECISGGVGVARQWARDLSLYDAHGRFFSPHKDEKTGALSISHPSWQEYTDQNDAGFVSAGFSEYEVAHKVQRYGNVATVFSSYEAKMASTGKLVARGVNIYQVYFAEGRWWITSVSWDDEKSINDIPAELTGKK